MRRTRRYADDIAGGQLLASTTFNGAAAFLMWCDRFRLYQFTADNKRDAAGLHKNDVDLCFVPLGLTVGFTANQ